MRGAPIPQRIAPLTWRQPAFLWTPLGLVIAIGAPYLAFAQDGAMGQAALIAGAFVYALALTTMGAAWALGRAPRSFREAALHVVGAAALAALAAPYALTRLLGLAAEEGAAAFAWPMALGVTPLAMVVGLPIALASGLAFAWVALKRPAADAGSADAIRVNVQPFR